MTGFFKFTSFKCAGVSALGPVYVKGIASKYYVLLLQACAVIIRKFFLIFRKHTYRMNRLTNGFVTVINITHFLAIMFNEIAKLLGF